MTHQFWPKLDNEACRTANVSVLACTTACRSTICSRCRATSGSRTGTRVSVGIENLLDEDPPCTQRKSDACADSRGAVQFPGDVLAHRHRNRQCGVRSARSAVLRQHELRILIDDSRRDSESLAAGFGPPHFFGGTVFFANVLARPGARARGNSTCSKSNRARSSSAKTTRPAWPGPECPAFPSRRLPSGSRRRAG